MEKIYIIDSILITDPDVFFKLRGCEIVIPMVAIREIDGIKRYANPGESRKTSFKDTRSIEKPSGHRPGAMTPAGSRVRIYHKFAVIDDPASKGDNRVVGAAIRIMQETKNGVILPTTDQKLRTVARSYGIQAESYPLCSGTQADRTQAKHREVKGAVNGHIENGSKINNHRESLEVKPGFDPYRSVLLKAVIIVVIFILLKSLK